MTESPLCFHHLEWPAPGARVAGPVLWLRGWVVGKAGTDFIDIRARTAQGVFLGVLGLPRTDLAAHFAPGHAWLPAEFIAAVPAGEGLLRLELEAQESRGNWIPLRTLEVTVAPEGAPTPRVEGELALHPGGGAVSRAPHLPLHGHLDAPAADTPSRDGVLPVFGWFVHDRQRIARVTATLDGRVFSTLASGLTDEELARKVPDLPAARHGRVRGTVPCFPTHFSPACLRVYVELDDGTVQLALARRLATPPRPAEELPPPRRLAHASLPLLPSGRPRRLLLVLRTMRPDDATLRALDLAAWLRTSGRWVVRAIAAEDGVLRERFESADCAVQLVDLRALFAARGPAVPAELARLDRAIWWRHLDAAALFDPTSDWVAPLAVQHGIPIFRDPAESLAWFAPDERYAHDATAPLLAPLRGTAAHGAPIALGAAVELERLHSAAWSGRPLLFGDVRAEEEEDLFRRSLDRTAVLRATPAEGPCAALVCPAWSAHPHRALLTAAVSGVPVITTPTPLLSATFAHGELVFVPPGHALALTHALLDLRDNPAAALRRAEAARRVVQAHDPATQLPRWLGALEAAVAAR